MSTTATATAAPAPAGAGGDARPSLLRLTKVELRKMADTRSGFWLLATVVLLSALAMVIMVFAAEEQDQTLREMVLVAIQPSGILLPIVGILLVTQEWSQRTGQVTFSLVPVRSRVIWAKLMACVALAVLAFAACVVLSLVGTAVAGWSGDDVWSWPAWLAGQQFLYLLTAMIIGFAVGALLLSPAPAIVLYFAAPIAFSVLILIPFLEDAGEWLDTGQTLAPLAERAMDGTEWAQAGTSLVLWMVVPLVAGLWRIGRAEIK